MQGDLATGGGAKDSPRANQSIQCCPDPLDGAPQGVLVVPGFHLGGEGSANLPSFPLL